MFAKAHWFLLCDTVIVCSFCRISDFCFVYFLMSYYFFMEKHVCSLKWYLYSIFSILCAVFSTFINFSAPNLGIYWLCSLVRIQKTCCVIFLKYKTVCLVCDLVLLLIGLLLHNMYKCSIHIQWCTWYSGTYFNWKKVWKTSLVLVFLRLIMAVFR